MKETMEGKVAHLEFLNREMGIRHHGYDEELLQYEYIKNGDMRAIAEATRMFRAGNVGHLSDDELRNKKYLFICGVTLATRFAIEGGMDSEKAYNASDLYIQKIDKAITIKEIDEIHTDMITYFTKSVAMAKKETIFSKQIVMCMDYIYYHLHEDINGEILAKTVGLNRSYLSTLFKKETGMNLNEYITRKRMEAAENMLKYSEYSLSDIGEYLNFSSYSHFARVFRKYFGVSPKEYRREQFRHVKMSGM